MRPGADPVRHAGVPDGHARILDEHRAAIARYADLVRALDAVAWTTPRAPGAWTPAEITRHLVLFFGVTVAELEGGEGARVRTGPVMRRLLRWFLLPHILFHRSFPLRARAPREVRPEEPIAEPSAGADLLLASATRFESAVLGTTETAGAIVTHPFFGPISPWRALRFSSVHVDHHRRQVEASLRAAQDS